MRSIIQALLFLSSAIIMVSCSDTDSSSSRSQDSEAFSSDESASSYEEASVEEKKDTIAKSCEVSMDNNKLYSGVNFDDERIVAETDDFVVGILSVYEPAEKPADTDNRKGSYLSLKILNQNGETLHSININNEEAVWVNIDGSFYHTENGEPAEFYEYVTGFLSENSY